MYDVPTFLLFIDISKSKKKEKLLCKMGFNYYVRCNILKDVLIYIWNFPN